MGVAGPVGVQEPEPGTGVKVENSRATAPTGGGPQGEGSAIGVPIPLHSDVDHTSSSPLHDTFAGMPQPQVEASQARVSLYFLVS
jgi:hypothetical protein